MTFILIGNMLTTYNSIGEGWAASLTSIFGLVLFFIGLNRLKSFLDGVGQVGVSKLIWAAILGIIAAFFSYIPLIGIIPAGILNIIAFILQLVGLLKLKNSATLGNKGASGVNYLLVAMVIMIIAGLLGILPFAGGYIKSVIALIAFVLIPFGWLKIQEAIIEGGNDATLSTSISSPTKVVDQNISQPLSAVSPIPQTNNFDFGNWLKKNKTIVIGVVGLAVILFGIYYFFLKHDPIKDGEKTAAAYCDCGKKQNEQMKESYKIFIDEFDSYKFPGKEAAQQKLTALEQSISDASQLCFAVNQERFTKLNGSYIGDRVKAEKFNYTYNAQLALCNNTDNELSSLSSQANDKINQYIGSIEKEQVRQDSLAALKSEIELRLATEKAALAFDSATKNPPSVDKMKQDILGKEYRNVNGGQLSSDVAYWTFESPEEIKKLKLLSQSFDKTVYSFTGNIEMELLGRNSGRWRSVAIITYIWDVTTNTWNFQNFGSQEFKKIN